MGRDDISRAVGARVTHDQYDVLEAIQREFGYDAISDVVRRALHELALAQGYAWPEHEFVSNEARRGEGNKPEWLTPQKPRVGKKVLDNR